VGLSLGYKGLEGRGERIGAAAHSDKLVGEVPSKQRGRQEADPACDTVLFTYMFSFKSHSNPTGCSPCYLCPWRAQETEPRRD
jgi:hypothetical protein